MRKVAESFPLFLPPSSSPPSRIEQRATAAPMKEGSSSLNLSIQRDGGGGDAGGKSDHRFKKQHFRYRESILWSRGERRNANKETRRLILARVSKAEE